jgi:hypothetical protein
VKLLTVSIIEHLKFKKITAPTTFVVVAVLNEDDHTEIISFFHENDAQKILDEMFLQLGAKKGVKTFDVNYYLKDGKLLI